MEIRYIFPDKSIFKFTSESIPLVGDYIWFDIQEDRGKKTAVKGTFKVSHRRFLVYQNIERTHRYKAVEVYLIASPTSQQRKQ